MRVLVIGAVLVGVLIVGVARRCAGLPSERVKTITLEVRLAVHSQASGHPIEGATVLIGRSADMDTPAERDQIVRLYSEGAGYMAACEMGLSDHAGNVTLTLRPAFSWAPTPFGWLTSADRPPEFFGIDAVWIGHEGYVPQLHLSADSTWTWTDLGGDNYRADLGVWTLTKL
jgi:hypothetical protein